jgi:hypothetical protein
MLSDIDVFYLYMKFLARFIYEPGSYLTWEKACQLLPTSLCERMTSEAHAVSGLSGFPQ